MAQAIRMQPIKAIRNGVQIAMRRCPDCWTYRDNYPHFDNGFVPVQETYVHHSTCPNRGQQ